MTPEEAAARDLIEALTAERHAATGVLTVDDAGWAAAAAAHARAIGRLRAARAIYDAALAAEASKGEAE